MNRKSIAIAAAILGLALASACKKDHAEASGEGTAASKSSASKTATEKASAAVDTRSVIDLASELAAVEQGDPDLAPEGFAKVVDDYRGKRFRWELYLVPELCRASQCNALALRDGGKTEGITLGWMPRLNISEGDREALLSDCKGTPQCPFTVEATVTDLVASTEQFTSVTLDQVLVL